MTSKPRRETSVDTRAFHHGVDPPVTIHNDDFLANREKKLVPGDSIDLVVTSPPYNIDMQYGEYKDDVPYETYLSFSRDWLAEAFRILKTDGRLCLNVPLDKNKGGQQSVCADMTRIAKDVGFQYHSTIIWNEGNISRRTAWGSWMSASAPYVIAPVEVIVVVYKRSWKKDRKGESDVTRDEFIEWTNGLWSFNGESKKKIGHPAPYPVELPRRCIKLFSYVGDTVLDPFLGSGTTLVASAMTGRRGIGFDVNPTYCELAMSRVRAEGAPPAAARTGGDEP